MACWGYLKEDSEYRKLLGVEKIPIMSIVPIIPGEDGNPLCYQLSHKELKEGQIEDLAQKLIKKYPADFPDIDSAIAYIKTGLPLQSSHFSSVGSDDYFHMPWGAALNALAQFNQAN